MKEELKTLKDIEGGIDEYYVKYYENIRKEAIKWVKECEKCSEHDERYYWATFIKHFFNLTEEELAGEGK